MGSLHVTGGAQKLRGVATLLITFAWAGPVHAAGSGGSESMSERALAPPATPPRQPDKAAPLESAIVAGDEAQRLSYVESAYGSSNRVVFGGVVSRLDSRAARNAQAGVLLGGSPLRRLTITALVERDERARFSPSAAAQYLFWGGGPARHALGALAQYKTEGFTELGGEVELGPLYSFRPGRFRLDLGALLGLGLEEERREAGSESEDGGEGDVEAKLRVAYQLAEPLRLGLLGRFRQRVLGERTLAGGKTWDVIGGGEVVASFGPFALAASGGPTTVNVEHGVAAYGMLSLALVSRL